MADPTLVQKVRSLLGEDDVVGALDLVLVHFEAKVGTVHRHDPASATLELVEQRGLPEALLSTVQRIPVGKGMAGLAASRREPVQVCNLQTDDSGVAKPGAKLTAMQGAISLPILRDDVLLGSFGVGKPTAHDYTAEEVALLEAVAREFARSV